MRLAYFIFFFLLISCNNEPEWKYLFNGENLDGWEIKIREHKIGENFKNTFKVDDAAIKVSYEEYDEFDKNLDFIFYFKYFTKTFEIYTFAQNSNLKSNFYYNEF